MIERKMILPSRLFWWQGSPHPIPTPELRMWCRENLGAPWSTIYITDAAGWQQAALIVGCDADAVKVKLMWPTSMVVPNGRVSPPVLYQPFDDHQMPLD